MTDVPALVTLHVWRVAPHRVAAAAAHTALDRRALRTMPGLTFAKLLGTGRGVTFGPRDTEPRRWALLSCWATPEAVDTFERSPVGRAWQARAAEELRVDLRPLSARGRWAGRLPFGRPADADAGGAVAVLTRARLRPKRAPSFYRSVRPVANALHESAGVRLAIGIGEAPVGWQGTFSIWDGAAAVRAFAYEHPAHADVVARTPDEGWYAEELFARFAVLRARGRIDGKDPMA